MAKLGGRKTGARPPKRRQRAKGQRKSGRRLTPRQRALIKGIAAGKSIARAARDAGYTDQSAMSVPYRNGNLRRAIAGLLDEAGLTDERLALRLRQLVDAKEVKVFYDRDESKVVYSKPLVAHDPRAKGLDMVLKLKGHYPRPEDAEDDRRGGPVVAIQLNIVGKDELGGNGKKRILDNIEFRTIKRSDGREGERQP